MLTFLPGETIITRLNGNTITLTTHRILKEQKSWGQQYNQSIMLEHITSCENLHTHYPWLLLVAGGLGYWAYLDYTARDTRGGNFAAFVAGVLVLVYFIRRTNVVAISSASSRMRIQTGGIGSQTVQNFINEIEQAKDARLKSVRYSS